jgi:AAA domain, putative AbiEii toxin, Type IV TA system/AAA domain
MSTQRTVADEIARAFAGARFFRADLHIHTFGASHDVQDSGFTAQAAVDRAMAEHLQIIGITDHNEISNVAAAIAAANAKNICVVPGVELSTPQGHLLAYLPTIEALQSFHGKLAFADRGTNKSRCTTGMMECLNQAEALGGFCVLAHVDGDGGLEKVMSGYPPHKADILCHRALVGLELRNAQSEITFSNLDPVADRVTIGKQRIEKLGLGKEQFLARVLFSDSHSLAAMGKNAQGNRRLTRMKMDMPSFNGVRIALQDADARTRLEDEIPEAIPYLMGMKITGGFLDGQTIHFSRNLNCIIGGRGAGKSTALEAARILSPVPSANRLIDSEAWPDTLELVWVDEAGQQHNVRRRIAEDAENVDDPILGSTQFPMECYGQNETAETSTKAEKDPAALLRYLDQFTGVADLIIEDEQLREKLLTNQSEIEKAQQQVNLIPETKRLLSNAQQQLKALESANATEVIALERKLAEEKSIRETIEASLNEITTGAKSSDLPDLITGIYRLSKPEDLKIGAVEFKAIVADLRSFEKEVAGATATIVGGAKILAAKVKKQLEGWRVREKQVATQIEQKRKELLDKGVKLDNQYIRKLASDEARFTKNLATLDLWQKKLRISQTARAGLLKTRLELRSAISTRRTAYGVKATRALSNTLGDLSVDVKFMDGALSEEATSIITETMNWRTSQVPKAALIVEQVTVPGLLKAIGKKDPVPLTKIAAADKSKPFSASDAREVIAALSQTVPLFRLERCIFDDLPRITVTKKIMDGGTPKYIPRDFARLSLGQQQSVLLALMLSSDSRYPLIIDQPEDNLDSEFIFHSLVPVLRAAKERRQVIIVTHNPNIAVLGDAEKIIAFKSTSDKSALVADGSIDDSKTKSVVCQILEGAEEAFKRRAQMYGII